MARKTDRRFAGVIRTLLTRLGEIEPLVSEAEQLLKEARESKSQDSTSSTQKRPSKRLPNSASQLRVIGGRDE